MVRLGRLAVGGVLVTTAMTAVACHPVERRGHIHFVGPESGFMQVNAKLDCPDTSGDLTRSAVSMDGTTCTYTGPSEESVSLQITPLMGAPPQTVLSKLESQLRGDAGLATFAPPPAPPAPPPQKAKDWDAGRDNQDADDNDKDDDDDSDHASSDKDGPKSGHTHIDLPGVHISANGDKADVQLPFLSIHANGDNAQVQAGWFGRHATIEGDNGGAVIRVGRADESGVDSMLIVASDKPGPSGYRTVGYLAKGPPSGPLVIAAFKAKGERHGEHDLAGDGLKRLVALNVHQGLGWFSNSADPDAKP